MKNIPRLSRIAVNPKDASSSLLNFKVLKHGGVEAIGYKTLRGFIKILKQQNKVLKKHGIRAKFDIILPVPE